MKNAYYFSHDYNAHNDTKILFLRQQLGMEGYGIYWFIIENLANAGGKLPLKIIPILAMQMQTSEAKIKVVINNFDLFQIVDDEFFSMRLLVSLDNLEAIRQKNSIKGKISAEKRKQKLIDNQAERTEVQPQSNRSSTTVQQRKGKESKGNERRRKYLYSDLGDLPELKVQASIELVSALRKITLTADEVQNLWSAWKKQTLDGETEYQTENKVYQHFLNSLKYQKFTDGKLIKSTNQNRTESKRNPGLYSLLDELRSEYAGNNEESQGSAPSL